MFDRARALAILHGFRGASIIQRIYNNVYISLLGHTRLIARSRCLDDTDIIIIAIRAL